jgi:hypothetical protein
MSQIIQIKDRLEVRLKPNELLVVKQALIQYLAATDPELTKTQFSNGLMDKLLPYLKDMNSSWSTMEADDLNTSWNAINTMYHSLRGIFRNPETIRKGVKEYIDEAK